MCNLSEGQQEQVREMDVESLAIYVFRLLKQRLWQMGTQPNYSWTSLGLKEHLFPNTDSIQSSYDRVRFLEAVVLLERRGLVVRDDSYLWLRDRPLAEFAVHLTSIGVKSDFDDKILLLVDKPGEIVGALEQKVGVLDSVVRQYYLESLRAYQEALYISSVICLGAASERAILWLAESIESSYPNYQKPIQQRRRKISDLTKYLSGSILRDIFPNDATFETELRKRLVLLGDLYRENRNEAGHPKAIDQSWLGEDQEILLIHFRRYITTIGEAIKRLKNNGNV